MSTDRERGSDKASAEQPEEISDVNRREALGRFAKYTAPAMLAVLLGDRAMAASGA